MSAGGMEITTVSICKNWCNYCPQKLLQSKYGPKEYMDLETFETCLSKIPKDIDILFAGFAEPFMNPLASQMMKIAIEQWRLVNLYTTLVDLRLEDINTLSGLKFNNIILHLPDDLGDMKCRVDQQYIDNLIKFINTLGYTSAHSYGKIHRAIHGLLQYNILPKTILHTRSNNINDVKQQERKSGNITCGVIQRHNRKNYNHNVLLPNGNVVLCCMDYGLKHILGNLLKDNYEDLFKSKNYKDLIEGLTNDDKEILCRTCSESIYV